MTTIPLFSHLPVPILGEILKRCQDRNPATSCQLFCNLVGNHPHIGIASADQAFLERVERELNEAAQADETYRLESLKLKKLASGAYVLAVMNKRDTADFKDMLDEAHRALYNAPLQIGEFDETKATSIRAAALEQNNGSRASGATR